MGKHVLLDTYWAQGMLAVLNTGTIYPTGSLFQRKPPALLKETTATRQEEDRPLTEARELKKSTSV